MSRIADMQPLRISFVSGSDLANKLGDSDEEPTRALIFHIVAVLSIAMVVVVQCDLDRTGNSSEKLMSPSRSNGQPFVM